MPDLKLFFVDCYGNLQMMGAAEMHSDSPELSRFPYGAAVLPTADRNGNAVIVFAQPGAWARNDVLVIEKPEELAVCSPNDGEVKDGRVRHRD
jgi:hypothetical protein